MSIRVRVSTGVIALLLLGLLMGCSNDSDASDSSVTEPSAETTATTDTAAELPPLADEDSYGALLGVGLDYSYDLALADGTSTIIESMEGYGAVRWTNGETTIDVTHRDVDGEWGWVYVDENVSVDSATPDALTDAERAEFQTLATDIVSAVGVTGTVTEQYTWKAEDGVMQGDYTVVDDTLGTLTLHFATDGQGRIGRIDLRTEA